MNQSYLLSQDCPATVIPAGDKVTLTAGTSVFITQTLGGNLTVRTATGLFRLAREDAAHLAGFTPPAATPTPAASEDFSEAVVWAALKTCFDPEIPVNIVDPVWSMIWPSSRPRRAATWWR